MQNQKIKTTRALLLTSTLLVLGACGNLNSVYRDFNIDDGTGAMVDIKQRAVIVTKQTTEHTDGTKETRTLVCAEPSPDALSAYAAEAAASADLPNAVTAQLTAASQESAAFVGLRTQSIQALRDALYRACEAVINGKMSNAEYGVFIRRYQKIMVALIGIEQLTGAVRVPPVVLTTEGKAEASRSLAVMRKEIDAIDTEIAEVDTKIIAQQAAKKKEGITEEDKTEIDKKIAALEKAKKNLEGDKKSVQDAISNARGLLSSGSASGQFYSVSSPSRVSDTSVEHITEAVHNIVKSVLVDSDDAGQICIGILLDPRNADIEALNFCKRYLDENPRPLLAPRS